MVDCAEFGVTDDNQFCRWMAKEVGVAAVPGSSFFHEPVNHLIRLHFSRNEEILAETVSAVEKTEITGMSFRYPVYPPWADGEKKFIISYLRNSIKRLIKHRSMMVAFHKQRRPVIGLFENLALCLDARLAQGPCRYPWAGADTP